MKIDRLISYAGRSINSRQFHVVHDFVTQNCPDMVCNRKHALKPGNAPCLFHAILLLHKQRTFRLLIDFRPGHCSMRVIGINRPKIEHTHMTKFTSGSSKSAVRTTFCSLLILLAITTGCKKDNTENIPSGSENETTGGQVNGSVKLDLGDAAAFTILAKSGITNTGKTAIQGNIGVSPIAATAITGFALTLDGSNQFSTSPFVTGNVYAADYANPTPAVMTKAINNMEAAYTTASGLTIPTPIVELNDGDISGRTIAPGIYKWSTGVLVSEAGVTLAGGPDDKWVFQIGGDLTLSSRARIKLTGGALAKNITWVVAGQAVLGTNSHLCGTILSKTLISLNTGAFVTGRLLAQTAVTLNASTVNLPK
jgi:hypothetical protein